MKFASLREASACADLGDFSVGQQIELSDGERYVLDRLDGDGPEWRPVASVPTEREYQDGEGTYAPKPISRRPRTFPDDSAARKEHPIAEGVLFYFPAALAQVARISKLGNDKHNPGEPMHHARGKSIDHADCQLRHMIDARESVGAERTEHLANKAWRALAELQEHCESEGAPLAPNAWESGK